MRENNNIIEDKIRSDDKITTPDPTGNKCDIACVGLRKIVRILGGSRQPSREFFNAFVEFLSNIQARVYFDTGMNISTWVHPEK